VDHYRQLSGIQFGQCPPSAPTRRGKIETQRTWRLSRVNPKAGARSLAAYRTPYRPVRPSKKLPAFSSHSVSGSTRRNRRLGDLPQIIVKGQEELSRGRFRWAGKSSTAGIPGNRFET
jgi:hypothetical protein